MMLDEDLDISHSTDEISSIAQLITRLPQRLTKLVHDLPKLLHIILHIIYLGKVVLLQLVEQVLVLSPDLVNSLIHCVNPVFVFLLSLFC